MDRRNFLKRLGISSAVLAASPEILDKLCTSIESHIEEERIYAADLEFWQVVSDKFPRNAPPGSIWLNKNKMEMYVKISPNEWNKVGEPHIEVENQENTTDIFDYIRFKVS